MFNTASKASLSVYRRMDEQARELQHPQIGTEHLLIALAIRDKGDEQASIAWQTLYQHDLEPIALRVRVENSTGRGGTPSPAHLPITLRLRSVVEFAQREQQQFGDDLLEPEHLLLGLLRESEHTKLPGVATIVLRQELGTSDIVPQLRSTVTQLMALKRALNGASGGHIVNRHELELWDALMGNVRALSEQELAQARDRAVNARQELAKAQELIDSFLDAARIASAVPRQR